MPTSEKSWNEWSRKVFEELVTLNARYEALANEVDDKFNAIQTGIEERYADIERKLEKINELLNGNGTPERGLIVRVDRLEQGNVEDLDVRVDRLEQKEVSRTWLIRTAIVAGLGSLIAAVVNFFKP